MVDLWPNVKFRFIYKRNSWLFVLLVIGVVYFRVTKGILFVDLYSNLIRPFWPGLAQKEWIQTANETEKEIRLKLLQEDNNRLRNILSLKVSNDDDRIPAAVISRSAKGWWQKLELNKGENQGVVVGSAVLGPGGLVGIIDSVTPFTSRVRLLTAPGSQLGVWVNRAKRHGVLIGLGTNRPQIKFLNKESNAKVGDFVLTSPASTLLPPNLPIGIIKQLDEKALPSPLGIVELSASPEAIDWVQILKN